MAARVTSMLPALEPSVLASRFISWNRKSSRLPALPAFFLPDAGFAAAVAQQVAQFFQVRAQSRQLFSHVDAQREQIGFLGQLFGQLGARDVIEAAGKAVSTLSRSLAASFSMMLGQQLGQVAFHGLDDAAHAVGALAHHRGQALASRSRPSSCVSACWAACRQAAPQTWDRARRCRAGRAS